VLDACTDLPRRPPAAAIQAMHLAVWGGRRYGLLIGLNETEAAAWAEEMAQLCLLRMKAD